MEEGHIAYGTHPYTMSIEGQTKLLVFESMLEQQRRSGMYVCMYVDCPWIGGPTGPGGGALEGSNVPTPQVSSAPRWNVFALIALSVPT